MTPRRTFRRKISALQRRKLINSLLEPPMTSADRTSLKQLQDYVSGVPLSQLAQQMGLSSDSRALAAYRLLRAARKHLDLQSAIRNAIRPVSTRKE